MKKTTTEKMRYIMEKVSLQAKKEVFDDIRRLTTEAIDKYWGGKNTEGINFISNKIIDLKKKHLNTSNTDSKNKEGEND